MEFDVLIGMESKGSNKYFVWFKGVASVLFCKWRVPDTFGDVVTVKINISSDIVIINMIKILHSNVDYYPFTYRIILINKYSFSALISLLIVDWSTFNSCAISVSVIDCANIVATFLRFSSILKLCITKISLCNILFGKVVFMHFEDVKV